MKDDFSSNGNGRDESTLWWLFRESFIGGYYASRWTGRFVRGTVSSAWVQKAVIGTTLLAITGTLLYIPAALGYLFFYYKFLPELETTVPVHLQYGVGPNPFGIASLQGLASRQPYDITVSLTLPRSPTNLDRGNFMIALHLLSPSTTTPQSQNALPYLPPANIPTTPDTDPPTSWPSLEALLQPTRLNLPSYLTSRTILHTTTRPALIPYVDPLASLASRTLFLLYHMLIPHSTASTVRLTVPMAEGLAFGTGGNPRASLLPQSLLLEVQAGQAIQVYEAHVTLVARLRGLRGLMYRWRVTSFVLCSAGFWVGEMAVLGVALLVVGQAFGKGLGDLVTGGDGDGDGDGGEGKREEGDGADGRKRVKQEGEGREGQGTAESSSASGPAIFRGEGKGVVKEEEEGAGQRISRVPALVEGSSPEADDEAEMKRGKGKGKGKEAASESKDVGIGTSYSGPVSGGWARRRRASG